MVDSLQRALEVALVELVGLGPADGHIAQTLLHHGVKPQQQEAHATTLHRLGVHALLGHGAQRVQQRGAHARWGLEHQRVAEAQQRRRQLRRDLARQQQAEVRLRVQREEQLLQRAQPLGAQVHVAQQHRRAARGGRADGALRLLEALGVAHGDGLQRRLQLRVQLLHALTGVVARCRAQQHGHLGTRLAHHHVAQSEDLALEEVRVAQTRHHVLDGRDQQLRPQLLHQQQPAPQRAPARPALLADLVHAGQQRLQRRRAEVGGPEGRLLQQRALQRLGALDGEVKNHLRLLLLRERTAEHRRDELLGGGVDGHADALEQQLQLLGVRLLRRALYVQLAQAQRQHARVEVGQAAADARVDLAVERVQQQGHALRGRERGVERRGEHRLQDGGEEVKAVAVQRAHAVQAVQDEVDLRAGLREGLVDATRLANRAHDLLRLAHLLGDGGRLRLQLLQRVHHRVVVQDVAA